MPEIHLNYGDPEADEALAMILELAAAAQLRDGVTESPEVTRVLERLSGDPRLSAWFVSVAGQLTSLYAHTIVEHGGGDFAGALATIEYVVGNALKGVDVDPDDDEED